MEDTEAMDLTWSDCLKILSAIKAARYKIHKKREADQRKGRFPPEGGADINLLHLEQYDELFYRVQRTARILEKRYKNEHNRNNRNSEYVENECDFNQIGNC